MSDIAVQVQAGGGIVPILEAKADSIAALFHTNHSLPWELNESHAAKLEQSAFALNEK